MKNERRLTAETIDKGNVRRNNVRTAKITNEVTAHTIDLPIAKKMKGPLEINLLLQGDIQSE